MLLHTAVTLVSPSLGEAGAEQRALLPEADYASCPCRKKGRVNS